jgi:hypothetical protein
MPSRLRRCPAASRRSTSRSAPTTPSTSRRRRCRRSIYRVTPDGEVSTLEARFGRPQGIAFDAAGTLYVTEALAGGSGLYRMTNNGAPELVLTGQGIVGVAFDSLGSMVVCSNETAYRLRMASSR